MNDIEGGDNRFVQLNMQTVEQANVSAQIVKDEVVEQPANTEQEEPSEEPQEQEPQEQERTENLSQQALNGAQITGLLTIIESMTAGVLDRTATKALITAAFPMLSETMIDAVLNGANLGSAGIVSEPEQQAGETDGEV